MDEVVGYSEAELSGLLADIDHVRVDDDDDDDEYREMDVSDLATELDQERKRLAGVEAEERKAQAKADELRQMRQSDKNVVSDPSIQAGKEEAKRQKELERLAARKAIKVTAPGLNIFEPARFLAAFTSNQLKLEEDFKYPKAAKIQRLKELGLNEPESIFTDPASFIFHLAPEAQSLLLSSEKDFVSLCDYLFFYCSSCTDQLLFDLYKRALFELIKNYAYKWRLTLAHVLTALCNLGADFEVICSQRHLTSITETRLSRIGKNEISVPKIFQFNTCLKEESNPNDMKECLRNFFQLLAELVSGYGSSRTALTPSSSYSLDWTHQLVFLYSISAAGSDFRLINDSFITRSMRDIFNTQLNSFSTFQWTGYLNTKDKEKVAKAGKNAQLLKQGCDEKSNACCDLTEVLSEVGGAIAALENASTIRTWCRDEVPAFEFFVSLDHHHNMLRRLTWLPISHRGEIMRRNIAYVNVQYLIDNDSIEIVSRAAARHLHILLVNRKVQLRALYPEYYLMFSLLRLADAVVGKEGQDFRNGLTHVEAVRSDFLMDVKARLRKVSVSDPEASTLNELLQQIFCKWKIMEERSSRETIFDDGDKTL